MHISSRDTSYESNNFVVADDKTKLAMENDNSEKNNLICGRTMKQWSIIPWSLISSASLCAFWGFCLWIFYQTLDNYTPKLQIGEGSFNTNPGLGFRPMRTETHCTIFQEENAHEICEIGSPYSSLIHFRHGARGTWKDLKTKLDEFIEEYKPGYWANAGASQTKCGFDSDYRGKHEACEFNEEWLSAEGEDYKCISEEHYGYNIGQPCLLLKLNRVYGWQPDPYNIQEIRMMNGTMPETLREHIEKTWQENCAKKGIREDEWCPELNMVWLHCDGEMAVDKENIGRVTYTPWMGFPGYFFPYWNQLGYLQPIVMVQLKKPTPAVLTNIQCTAWARNIQHNDQKMRGSVHIEFLMD